MGFVEMEKIDHYHMKWMEYKFNFWISHPVPSCIKSSITNCHLSCILVGRLASTTASPTASISPAVMSHPPQAPILAFKSGSVYGPRWLWSFVCLTLLALVSLSRAETKAIVRDATKGDTLPQRLGPPSFLTLSGTRVRSHLPHTTQWRNPHLAVSSLPGSFMAPAGRSNQRCVACEGMPQGFDLGTCVHSLGCCH